MNYAQQISAPKLAEIVEKIEYILLDHDDCLYDLDAGMHDITMPSIANTFNKMTHSLYAKALKKRVAELFQENNITVSDINNLNAEEGGAGFNAILQAIEEMCPHMMDDYIKQTFSVDYSRIKPSPELAEAFNIFSQKSIGLYSYTSGPAPHMAHTLNQHQVNPKIIAKLVDKEHSFDIVDANTRGLRKPSEKGMQHVIDLFKLDPNKTLFADDNIKNLRTASNFGITPLWTWTSDREPSKEGLEIADQIGAIRVRHTGPALLQIANAIPATHPSR